MRYENRHTGELLRSVQRCRGDVKYLIVKTLSLASYQHFSYRMHKLRIAAIPMITDNISIGKNMDPPMSII